MDKLRAMAHFAAIVEQSSLTAAARREQTSVPTVVRSLSALEDELGVRLMNRTTRRVALTEEGRGYYEHVKLVLSQIHDAERALAERRRVPRGRLVVTAPVLFGRLHVAPLLIEFGAAWPELSLELVLLDRVTNLTEEGIDLAVRIGKLADSSLVATPVGKTPLVVCASPSYLRERRAPERPEHLSRHVCVRYVDPGPWKEWTFLRGERRERVATSGVFDTNQIEVALEACRAGRGLGRFLGYQVKAYLESGELERVLARYEPKPLPVQVVIPHARGLSARVRSLLDFLVPRLRKHAAEWTLD
jgi:DNA-binding transcriptional LysR family regulator